MAKEKRAKKEVEDLEALESCTTSNECADSCSSVSDGCGGRVSNDCGCE
ncbi:hypothetical protein [Desulforamulus aquiferis]|uniref:Uncharacterized protein n=1 Tax=Desulforamulus aquiferis TaxID=1397668 RepID=A0AAW7Z966_9FIRM|nr:hypothetical protein [Desulforamulus aquiferis]MDO7785935.1 hypothetical protein [Desulforamulus aquiferis]RYD02076.1 hypothetical protein N752_26870 [Desulforamulus aquiferis]